MFHDYKMLWWCFMTIQCCGDVSWLYNAVVMFHDYTMLWWCFMTIQCCGDVSWLYNAVVMFHDYTMLWWCFMTIQCCGDVSWLYNAVVMFHDYTMLWWCFMTIQCCGDVSWLYNAVVMFHDYTMLWWCFMTIQCCGDVSWLYNAVVMFHDYTMLWWCSGLHMEVCMLGMQMLGDMNCMWGKRCYQEFNPWQWEAQWSPSSNNLRLFNLFTNLLFCRNALPGYHKVERKKNPSDLTPVPYLRIKFGMHAFFENDNRYFEPVSVAASDWNRNCIPWQTDQWCCSGSQQRTQPQKMGFEVTL